MSDTKRVLITGAAGQIGYSLIPLAAGGQVCGFNTKVELVLLDVPQAIDALKGVVMEIEDGAYPLLKSVTVTDDVNVAFKDVSVAMMVGGFPRLPGMDRRDLLSKNAQIFVAAGKALEAHGSKDCRVLVVANPANTNCLIMQRNAPSIPKENFSCLTRLDHNRALSQIAAKLNVTPGEVSKMTIWGNHSNTMVPDLSNVEVNGKKIADQVDKEWVSSTFVPTVQTRGAAVLAARQKSSAMSAANAAANHMYTWLNGTPEGDWVSMGIVSEGWYGVAKDIIFSFPVTVKDGKVTVVEGLTVDEELAKGLKKTEEELIGEKDIYESF
jgi:malate dehydrogenase